MTDETEHLESIARRSEYCAGVNLDTIRYSFEIFARFIKGRTLLEMGPAEGMMTDELARLGLDMTVVEGSRSFCASLSDRHPQMEVVHSLFEDFAPTKRFDNIILGHVLEHVDDPVAVLKSASGWLSEGGMIMAAVPNSRSLHRQAAVVMGLLAFEEELNEADRRHGHRRVYNPETFRRDFRAAGLDVQVFGGYWLKPLSNAQIEQTWSPELLAAYMAVGERYPDIAGEIYIIAGL